jgi:aspartokinase
MVREEVGEMNVTYDREVGIVSIFGPHFGDRPGIAGAMFSVLAEDGINILAISTSISSVSCLLAADDMDRAVSVLEEAFESP